MNLLAFILVLAAAIVFAVETYLRKSLIALGLTLATFGWLWEAIAASHTVHQ